MDFGDFVGGVAASITAYLMIEGSKKLLSPSTGAITASTTASATLIST